MSPGVPLLIVAPEASGDLHAARVLDRLLGLCSDVRPFGLGGARLQSAGLELLADPSVLNVVGVSEALVRLGQVLHLRRVLLSEVERRRPLAALLVDLPGFNLNLAGHLRRLGVKIAYYIAPQAWAWRRARVRKIRARVDRLCAIFPFEREFFSRFGIPVEYVGHPLFEAPDAPSAQAGHLALVPGSRIQEVERLLPAMAGAATLLRAEVPSLTFKLPLAPGIERGRVERLLGGLEVELVTGGASAALAGARLGLVASGTATLEGARLGVPMVVLYRLSWLSYALARALVRIPRICIVNILAGREIVPELLQGDARPENIAARALSLLKDGRERREVIVGLRSVVQGLEGPEPSLRVAEVLCELMQPRRSALCVTRSS